MTLIEEDSQGEVPRHVAIIMDGNGRWARNRGKPRLFGHHKGVENVRRVVDAAKEAEVPYLTLYAFSVENQNRPKDEVTGLMRLLREFLKKEIRNMVKDGVRLRTIGDVAGLPEYAQKIVEEAVEKTKSNDSWNLTLALNYGSRQETLNAIRVYAEKISSGKASPKELNWDTFSSYLYTAELPDPDLIIRTSGEHRLSNFLLLQAAYAEIYVTPDPWPEFTADKFHLALQDYASRERRYGKTGEQIRLKSSISETPVSV